MIPLLVPAGIRGAPAVEGFAMRSLRLDGSSAYLDRTFSAGNRTTWTLSLWLKRSTLATTQRLFGVFGGSTDSNFLSVVFTSGDKIQVSGGVTTWRVSTPVFRDVGAWYHLVLAVDTTQGTANNRLRLYVNGNEITAFDTLNNPGASATLAVNSAAAHHISSTSFFLSGYLADVVLVDGMALTPSSFFGQTNATTGKWEPKPNPTANLTMGTNGFWLSFDNNSSAANLGLDDAGGARGSGAGSKDWTMNNFSVAAGVNNDSLFDVPMSYDDGANGRGNYCTLSRLAGNTVGTLLSLTDGQLRIATGSAAWSAAAGTIAMASGKWYWEGTATQLANGQMIGLFREDETTWQGSANLYPGSTATSYAWNSGGNKYNNAAGAAYGSVWAVNDVIGVAFDADSGKLFFAKNNAWQASGNPVSGTGAAYTVSMGRAYLPAASVYNTADAMYVNFGQRPFAYAPPTGFKALCTQNLPAAAIVRSGTAFDVQTYTGNGGTKMITGLNFSPDLVWIKSRSAATGHRWTDNVRGATLSLDTSSTAAEATESTGLTAFNLDGFALGADADYNTSAATYAAWCWDEAVASGFDIVTFTSSASGTTDTIAHGLGVVPAMIIVKSRAVGGGDWTVWNKNLASATDSYLSLNSAAAAATYAGAWGSGPTASNFQVKSGFSMPSSASLAYVFAEVPGFSKFGAYGGNGSTDGPFLWCGFRPRFLLVKSSNGVNSWNFFDAARDPYNIVGNYVTADIVNAEGAVTIGDFMSNGVKIWSANAAWNGSGYVYIFVAFAESPFKHALAR